MPSVLSDAAPPPCIPAAAPEERPSTRWLLAPVGARWTSVAAAIAAGAFALLVSLPFVSHLQADTYKALYDGRWIAAHGLPQVEALTVMAHGRRWIDEQWLAELLLYDTWRAGGYPLLAGLAAGLVALAFGGLAALMIHRGASAVLSLACSIMAVLCLSGWQFPRSQDFALPLFVALAALILGDRGRTGPNRRLLLVVPVLVLWANLHGSVLLGALLGGAYFSWRALSSTRAGRRGPTAGYVALASVSILAPLATPYGLGIIHYYLEFIGNKPMARLAVEWASPRFPSFIFFELAVPLVLVTSTLLLTLRHRRPSVVLIAGTVLAGAAACIESGSIVWFALLSMLLVAESAQRWWPWRPALRTNLLVLLSVGVALGTIVSLQVARRSGRDFESALPARVLMAADQYAVSHPCARIMADNLTASALLWHEPALTGRIAFDARLEQYPRVALSRWVDFQTSRATGWERTAAGFRVLVADPLYARSLATRLARLPRRDVLATQDGSVAALNPADAGREPCPSGGTAQ